MDIEMDGLIQRLSQHKIEQKNGYAFHTGFLGNASVVLLAGGVGKVNAATGVTAMIAAFSPKAIINTGVAAGGKGLRPLDIVFGERVCQHDVDTSAVGDPIGLVSTVNKIFFPCDEGLLARLCSAADELGIAHCRGTVASGDQFVATNERKRFIEQHFQAKAIEMEAGAIGQVCDIYQIPYAVIRAISDGGDDDAALSYEEFKRRAAEASLRLLARFFGLE